LFLLFLLILLFFIKQHWFTVTAESDPKRKGCFINTKPTPTKPLMFSSFTSPK
jgi:hypothetical protein